MASTLKYKSDIDIVVNAQDNTSDTVKGIESSVIRMVGAIASATAVLTGLAFPAIEAAKFEAALLDVKKTTGFTNAEIKDLGNEMLLMSQKVNISAIDLTKIAAIAGQLGLGAKGGTAAIAAFTDTAARFASVLDVTVEKAATNIAKITNVFDIAIKDAESVSAAINEISNSSTAAGSDILDITNRIGDIGGVSLSDVIGIAAFSKDVGLANEVASTSFSKMIANLTVRAESFATLMGMSTQSWVEVVNQDALGALFSVAEALNQMGTASANAFTKTNIGGGRIFTAFTKLKNEIDAGANSMDEYRISALQAQIAGTSSIEEQANVLSGLSAQATILFQNFQNLAEVVGADALPYLKEYVQEWSTFLKDPNTINGAKQLAAEIGSMASIFLDLAKAILANTETWNSLATVMKLIIGFKMVGFVATLAAKYVGLTANVAGVAAAYRVAAAEQKSFLAGQVASVSSTGATSKTSANTTNVSGAGLAAYTAQTKAAILGNQALVTSMKEVTAADTSIQRAETAKAAALSRTSAERTAAKALVAMNTEARKTMTAEDKAANLTTKRLLDERLALAVRAHKAETASYNKEIAKRKAALAAANATLSASATAALANPNNVGITSILKNISVESAKTNVSMGRLNTLMAGATAGASRLQIAVRGIASAAATAGKAFLAMIPVIGEIVLVGWLAYEAWKAFATTSKEETEEMVRKRAIYAKLTSDLEKQTKAQKSYNEELAKTYELGNLEQAGAIAAFSGDGEDDFYARRATLLTSAAQAAKEYSVAQGELNRFNALVSTDTKKLTELEALAVKQREALTLAQERAANVGTDSSLNLMSNAAAAYEETKAKIDEINKSLSIYSKGADAARNTSVELQSTMRQLTSTMKGAYTGEVIDKIAQWTTAVSSQAMDVRDTEAQIKSLRDELSKLGEAEDADLDVLRTEELTQEIKTLEKYLAAAQLASKNTLASMKKDFIDFGNTSGQNTTKAANAVETMAADIRSAGDTGQALATVRDLLAGVATEARNAATSVENWADLVPAAIALKTRIKAIGDELRDTVDPAIKIATEDQKRLNDSMEDYAVTSRDALTDVAASFNEVRIARERMNAENEVDDKATTNAAKRVKYYEDEVEAIKARVAAGTLTEAQGTAYIRIAQSQIAKAQELSKIEEAKLKVYQAEASMQAIALAAAKARAEISFAANQGDTAEVLRLKDELEGLSEQYKEVALAASSIDFENAKGKDTLLLSDAEVGSFEAQVTAMVDAGSEAVRNAQNVAAPVAENVTNALVTQKAEINKVLIELNASLSGMLQANAELRKTVNAVVVDSTDAATAIDGSVIAQLLDITNATRAATTGGMAEFNADMKALNDEGKKYLKDLNDSFKDVNTTITSVKEALVGIAGIDTSGVGNLEALSGIDDIGEQVRVSIQNGLIGGIDITANEALLTESIRSAIESDSYKVNGELVLSGASLDTVARTIAARISANGTAQGFASGGRVRGRGTGTSDSIPAWLSNGEYVIDAATVRRMGSGFFQMLQKGKLVMPKFSTGGLAGAAQTINNNGLQLAGVHKMEITNGGESYTLFADKRSVLALDGLLTRTRR